MRRDDFRNLMQAMGGPRGAVMALASLIEGRDQHGREIPKLRPEDVSIRGLYEAMVGPVEDTLMMAGGGGVGNLRYVDTSLQGIQEAIDSTMFPSATGVLISSKVIEGYNAPGMIGDQLVTIMPSRLRNERIVGFTDLEGPEEVPEGMPYAESGFSEKYVTTQAAKKGRLLEITEETIFFDQTGQILVRAAGLGQKTAEEREEMILAGVLDVGGATGTANGKYKAVYRPQGIPTNLYDNAANQNNVTAATPLVDWTDMDEAFQYSSANMVDDRAVASERRPIIFMPKVLLVSRKKFSTAARILTATMVSTGDITTGTGSSFDTPNPIGTTMPMLRLLSSPLIDYLATVPGSQYDDSDDWFIGDPQRQFFWQEIWPLQTFRASQEDDARFRRDIIARFKVRYFGGIFAADHRYMLKVNDT